MKISYTLSICNQFQAQDFHEHVFQTFICHFPTIDFHGHILQTSHMPLSSTSFHEQAANLFILYAQRCHWTTAELKTLSGCYRSLTSEWEWRQAARVALSGWKQLHRMHTLTKYKFRFTYIFILSYYTKLCTETRQGKNTLCIREKQIWAKEMGSRLNATLLRSHRNENHGYMYRERDMECN
jgi:hypothetical protein